MPIPRLARSILLCSIVLAPGALAGSATPLTALPYTPSLDLTAMDKTVNPCEDFYQFSCGDWIRKNPIPADQPSWGVYQKLNDDNQRFLWGLLQQAATPSASRSAIEQKTGDYFAACMNEEAIDKAGMTSLTRALDQVDAVKSKRQLARFLGDAHLRSSGDGLAFGFGPNQDFADSSQVIAFADAGGLGLPDRDYYVKTDAKSAALRDKYRAHVQRMMELIGESPRRAAASASTVLAMETALAQASLTNVDRRDPYKLFHKRDRAELRTLTPHFAWDDYLDQAGIASITTVNVTEPKFFRRLDALIRDESLAHWRSYLRWQLTRARSPYLSRALADASFDFYGKTLRGVGEQQPRWKHCVQWVDRDLGEALGQLFVARTFSASTKLKTVEMTRLIEDAMREEIGQLPWMGPETKRLALVKLEAIVNKVGYPDRWRDYSALEIGRDDFYANVERSIVFESKRKLAKIGKPLDRGEWEMTPPTVNAYYAPQMNDINFPAGILQPPLYDAKLDDAPNYGDTGSTIGHELTHAFDDEGRQFDAHGNLKDWWTPQDAKAFTEQVECVQSQYAGYVAVDDIHINSKLTSGEDVADLGGTLLAWIAWKKATAGVTLPPVDGFTPDQRFFVGLAQWACDNQRPEQQRLLALTDPHSPNKYRVNGLVANLPQFRQAFSCKAGQPMAREKPCKVW